MKWRGLDLRWHGTVGILVNAIFWRFRLVTWGLRALRQLALALMQMQYVDHFLISSCYLIFVSFRVLFYLVHAMLKFQVNLSSKNR